MPIAIFTKPFDLVTFEDIEELVGRQWPESFTVEFKETLPQKQGRPHPWLTGGDDLDDFAQDKIFKEIVALANAGGGSLILGVKEAPGDPPRAEKLIPLPRAAELTRRFEDAARSGIDPTLARLEIRPLLNADHAGVIVFRVEQSRQAPHQVRRTSEAFVRRGSSSAKMTMREIQDMTLRTAGSLAATEAMFSARASSFHHHCDDYMHRLALRMTAVPLVDLPLAGRLYGRSDAFPAGRILNAIVEGQRAELDFPSGEWTTQPSVRGIKRYVKHKSLMYLWEIKQDGLMDLWVIIGESRRPPMLGQGSTMEYQLYNSDYLGAVGNLLAAIEHHRNRVGAPGATYGLELEVWSSIGDGVPRVFFGLWPERNHDRYPFNRAPGQLPIIEVGPVTEFAEVLTVVNTDLNDAFGIMRSKPFEIEISL